jgi:hypothetical protein
MSAKIVQLRSVKSELVAVGQLPILNAAMTDEIIRRARRAAFCKITRSANHGGLHRSHDPHGNHISHRYATRGAV